jgi:4-carboxymuconolactone decarboxylase
MIKTLGASIACASILIGGFTVAADSGKFSPRLTTPRLQPIGKEGRTPEQEKMLASRADYNIYKTLAHHPELYTRWSGLGQYLLSNSTLPPRDREIIILRMGWLCQAPYEWSQHARIAKDIKMSDAEIHAIAEGVDAKVWSDFDRTLIAMVDEIRYDAQISDKTWAALRAKYSIEQTIDAFYTGSQYQLVSMALNSLGVQLDPALKERIPIDLKMPALAERPKMTRLKEPRVKPVPLADIKGESRDMVAMRIRDGQLPNLYATLIVHPKFYAPRASFGLYLQRESKLPPKTRELVIMRTAWLLKTEYEWAHHVPLSKEAGLTDEEIARIAKSSTAFGWSDEHRAVLQAVDELRREAFISETTWTTLKKYYNTQQLLEIVYTTGGYSMTAVAINSLGIQVEPGYPSMPRE